MHYLLLLTALITIGFTSLVSVPGSPFLIGGMTQADISAMFATSITPAGVTFAIWSVIYLSWIAAGLTLSGLPFSSITKRYFPRFIHSLEEKKIHKKTIWSFSLAIFLTGVWLIPWGNIFIGSALLVMLAILGLLGYAWLHMRKSQGMIRWSIELTLAWIIMATALNVTVWIRYIGWDIGWPDDVIYGVSALLVLSAVVASLQYRHHAYIISGVFLWTLIGMWIAHPIELMRAVVIICALPTILNMIYSYQKK